MLAFTALHASAYDLLGYIPEFLDERDPRPAKEQIHEAYRHGGGWHEFKGFTVHPTTKALQYPGDPVYYPIAAGKLRDEMIYVYQHGWVMIEHADETHSIARID